MKTEFKPKKILITGHQGFIGAWVSFALYSLGFELYGVDNRSSYGERLFDKADLKDIFIEERIIDVEDLDLFSCFVAKTRPEIIIHLAGQAIIPRAFNQPFLTFKSNALSTLSVLEAVRLSSDVKSLIAITSDKVYQNDGSSHSFNELDMLGGSDIYSVSKSSAEFLCRAYSLSHLKGRDINIQTVRLGNVVGGGDWSVNRLIPDLINSAYQNNIFKVRYMNAIRPFQHITDVVSGILNITNASVSRKVGSGESWNLGPRDNSFGAVKDVIDTFKHFWPKLIVSQEEKVFKEDLVLSVDVGKYSNFFKKPYFNSNESIEMAIQWYKKFYEGASPKELMVEDLKILSKEQ